MGFENFPYTNFHELNLDWIAKIAKDFLEQYTHIQELIANGEQSLQDLTASGLADLQAKADELEQLLQEWYNTHSEDIGNQLADALEDLNAQLNTNMTQFSNSAVAKGEEVLASIPADYTALGREVAENKADTNFIMDEMEFVDENPYKYMISGYYNTSGEIQTHSNYSHTNMLKIKPYTYYRIRNQTGVGGSATAVAIAWFDANKNFNGYSMVLNAEGVAPATAHYMSVCNDNANTPAIRLNYVNRADQLTEEVVSIEKYLNHVDNPSLVMRQGYIKSDGSIITFSNYTHSEMFRVIPGSVVTITNQDGVGGSADAVSIAFYDINKAFISAGTIINGVYTIANQVYYSSVCNNSATPPTVTIYNSPRIKRNGFLIIPTNTHHYFNINTALRKITVNGDFYVVSQNNITRIPTGSEIYIPNDINYFVLVWNAETQLLGVYNYASDVNIPDNCYPIISGDINSKRVSASYAKYRIDNISESCKFSKIAVLGDSISALSPTNNWVTMLAQKANANIINYSVAGSRIGNYSGSAIDGNPIANTNTAFLANMATKLINDESNVDMVIIFMGTNDEENRLVFNTQNYFDQNGIVPHENVSTTTLGGGLRYTYDILQTAYNCPVLIITPIYAEYSSRSIDRINKADEVISMYANLLGLKVLHGTEFDISAYNASTYTVDGLHPNTDGNKLIAMNVYGQIADWLNSK